MATVLKLCQDAARECGIAGTGPTTTVDQTGELADIIRWLSNYYVELQSQMGGTWRFLEHGFTLPTVADQQAYVYTEATDTTSAAAIDRLGRWYLDPVRHRPRCYLTSSGVSGEYRLNYISYEEFAELYFVGTPATGQPSHVCVDPQDQILIGPTPDDVYTITGRYFRGPQVLAANNLLADDTEVPELPAQFHQLLVYGAMDKYAGYQSAPEIKTRMRDERRILLGNFRNHQTPRDITLGRPMA
jgi:hypothetical protein